MDDVKKRAQNVLETSEDLEELTPRSKQKIIEEVAIIMEHEMS